TRKDLGSIPRCARLMAQVAAGEKPVVIKGTVWLESGIASAQPERGALGLVGFKFLDKLHDAGNGLRVLIEECETEWEGEDSYGAFGDDPYAREISVLVAVGCLSAVEAFDGLTPISIWVRGKILKDLRWDDVIPRSDPKWQGINNLFGKRWKGWRHRKGFQSIVENPYEPVWDPYFTLPRPQPFFPDGPMPGELVLAFSDFLWMVQEGFEEILRAHHWSVSA
ncbi:hypothetical protein ACFL3S_13745, partial [Gemmatimonadota bacterium]